MEGCVCVCVCLGPFQTATIAVCTQMPNRSWGWGSSSLQAEAVSCLSCRKHCPAYSLHCVGLPKDSEFMQVETSLGTDGGSASSTLLTQIHI